MCLTPVASSALLGGDRNRRRSAWQPPEVLRVVQALQGRRLSREDNEMDWYKFLSIATKHLSLNPCSAPGKRSWCAWTTFERLGEDAGYWTGPLPLETELLARGTSDGGTWAQPFLYSQIAHVVIPRRFYCEQIAAEGFGSGVNVQDVEGLSVRLTGEGLPHRITELVLEVKLY